MSENLNFSVPKAYEVVKVERLDDISSEGVVLRHIKSGARVCLILNDDENKVFCAAFRTTPFDSTGVPHIIEHTVLNGSEHFPSRDPFMSLVKGSLHTFLNAMTYPDKTMFPVASCNDADFKNLMHVYLDSVFHPNIYRRREIFMQEGWHYEMETPEDELKINGVVYSEMKGALSTPDSVIFENLQQKLYPDTTYGVNSGGDPAHIPELTYEAFLDFHRRYYHPCNSYIYLYGNVDAEERLSWLDENYLSAYDKIDLDSHIDPQPRWGGVREEEGFYSVGAGDEVEGKSYFGEAYLLPSLSRTDSAAFEALADSLIYSPGAPVRQALLDAGIGRDITGGLLDQMLEPSFAVVAKEANGADRARFFETVEGTLRRVVKDGIDRNSLLSFINSSEFRWREADFGSMPKGLVYIINSLSTWLYDEDAPFDALCLNKVYAELRDRLDSRYFEELIEKYVLGSDHTLRYTLTPEPGLVDKQDAKLREKLAAYKASLTKEDIDKIVADTKGLRDYQSAPPTEAELSCIPSLARSDISREAKPFYNTETTVGGVPAVRHELDTHGVAYIRLYFKADGIPTELLPCAGLLGSVLGAVDTEKHGYFELSNEIGIHTGGVYFGVGTTPLSGKNDEYRFGGSITIYALTDKVGRAMELAGEIVGTSKLDDKKRLREIIGEVQSGRLTSISGSGNSYGSLRAQSYFSKTSVVNDLIGGIGGYLAVKEAAADTDAGADEIIRKLKAAIAYIFRPENLLVSVAADDDAVAALASAMPEFLAHLHTGEKPCGSSEIVPVKKNEGFMIPSAVNYVTRAGNMFAAGHKYTGAYSVLSNSLRIDYLYQEIRVKGGAYGQSCGFGPVTGNVTFSSFRDPQLRATDEVYRKTSDFVRAMAPDEGELTKLIIGTFSGLDFPKTTRQTAAESMDAYLMGRRHEDIQREREEALDVTVEDLRACADAIDDVVAQGYVCTVGNEAALRANADMFDTLVPLS